MLNSLTLPPEWQQRILAYLVSAEGGLTVVERQRQHLLAQFERLKELYLAGDRTAGQYQQEKAQLQQALAGLLTPPDLDNAQVQALLADLPKLWGQATPAELKDLLEALFQRIYLQDQDIVRLVAFPAFLPCLTRSPLPVSDPGAEIAGDTLTLPGT